MCENIQNQKKYWTVEPSSQSQLLRKGFPKFQSKLVLKHFIQSELKCGLIYLTPQGLGKLLVIEPEETLEFELLVTHEKIKCKVNQVKQEITLNVHIVTPKGKKYTAPFNLDTNISGENFVEMIRILSTKERPLDQKLMVNEKIHSLIQQPVFQFLDYQQQDNSIIHIFQQHAKLKQIKRFNGTSYEWSYDNMIDAVIFQSTKKIFLAGFGIYKSSKDDILKCEAGIYLGPTYNSELFYRRNFEINQKDQLDLQNDKIFMFLFPNTLEVVPHQQYLIYCKILKGLSFKGTLCNTMPYFEDDINDIYTQKEFVKFTTTSLSENGTTETNGQLPVLYFY